MIIIIVIVISIINWPMENPHPPSEAQNPPQARRLFDRGPDRVLLFGKGRAPEPAGGCLPVRRSSDPPRQVLF